MPCISDTYDAVVLTLSGLTEDEIANRLGMSQPSVSRCLNKACRNWPGLSGVLAFVRDYHKHNCSAERRRERINHCR